MKTVDLIQNNNTTSIKIGLAVSGYEAHDNSPETFNLIVFPYSVYELSAASQIGFSAYIFSTLSRIKNGVDITYSATPPEDDFIGTYIVKEFSVDFASETKLNSFVNGAPYYLLKMLLAALSKTPETKNDATYLKSNMTYLAEGLRVLFDALYRNTGNIFSKQNRLS